MNECPPQKQYDPYDFELLVKNIFSSLLPFHYTMPIEIFHRKRYEGKRTGHKHEIDLSFETDIAGSRILVLIECKAYKGPVKVDDVLAFAERIDDIGANKGIIVTLHGFQPGAIRVAEARGIALVLAFPHEERFGFVQRFHGGDKAKAENLANLAKNFGVDPEKMVQVGLKIKRHAMESFSSRKDHSLDFPKVPPFRLYCRKLSQAIETLRFF